MGPRTLEEEMSPVPRGVQGLLWQVLLVHGVFIFGIQRLI